LRLSTQTIKHIKQTFKEVFGNGNIYLFGSRVDDTKRGGDIDLYIDLEERLPYFAVFSKKIDFLGALNDN
jgi:predicted nucleotidyltransferase